MSNFFQNTCKPQGFGGKIMVNVMNSGHAKMAEWGFGFLKLKETDTALDIGCGGGANIAYMLKQCTKGIVKGIDYSEVSVEKSRKVNADAIKEEDSEIIRAIRSTKMGGRELLALLDNIQAGNVTFLTAVNNASEEAIEKDA